MIAKINIYQDKRKLWRWNVMISENNAWNTVCQCTDPKDSAEWAEIEARAIICQAWEVDTDIVAPKVPWWKFWE